MPLKAYAWRRPRRRILSSWIYNCRAWTGWRQPDCSKADPATQGIKVVALTAFAMKGDEQRMRAAGCDDYIPKPIQHMDFVARISGLLAVE